MTFEFAKSHRGLFDAAEMCEALRVSTSGYNRWERSEPSLRRREDESLKESVLEIHGQTVGDYGYRPVYHNLIEKGACCGRNRTLRLSASTSTGSLPSINPDERGRISAAKKARGRIGMSTWDGCSLISLQISEGVCTSPREIKQSRHAGTVN